MTQEKSRECSCEACVSACHRFPGWPTPDEAERFINDGLAGKLMKDWLPPSSELGNEDDVYVLCPAQEGREGGEAPFLKGLFFGMSEGTCVFLTEVEKCSVHGHKPMQCRMIFCCDDDDTASKHGNGYSNFDIAALWNTPKGRALIERWEAIVVEQKS